MGRMALPVWERDSTRMANHLSVQIQQSILSLAGRKWPVRRIARELGISRNTVRDHIRAAQGPPASASAGPDPSPGQTDPLSTTGVSPTAPTQTDPLSTTGTSGRQSLCLVHESFIRTQLESGLNGERIFRDLKSELGFSGSYQSVKRFVAKLRSQEPKLVNRVEVAPGEEMQVDFAAGPLLMEENARKSRCWIFRCVLSHSRKGYTEAVLRQDTESFLRCIENAFRRFGGVPLTLNLDNLKAGVIRFSWADPELNPKLRDFALHYGIAILPCRPKTPEHKGKVENSIRYVRQSAVTGRKFASVAALSLALREWEDTVADLRIHGTTRRQVAAMFAEEKKSLQPLPDGLFPCFQECRRTVHRDGYIELAKSYYHVPAEFLGAALWVRFDSREVRIFSPQKDASLKQVQYHRRLEAGQFSQVLGHGGGHGTIQRQLDHWLSRCQELGTSCAQWSTGLVARRGITSIRSLMGLQRLVESKGYQSVNQACARAIAKGSWKLSDVSALIGSRESQTQLAFQEAHPLIRNLGEYGSFFRKHTSHSHEPNATATRAPAPSLGADIQPRTALDGGAEPPADPRAVSGTDLPGRVECPPTAAH